MSRSKEEIAAICEMHLFAKGPPIKMLAPIGVTTFDQDDSLPALPVPKLADSLALYLDSVKPIAQSPEEFEKTRRLVEEFQLKEGPRLQQLLENKATTTKNWLEEVWLEVAYLYFRQSSIPFSNFCGDFGAHKHALPPNLAPGTQAHRAGIYTHYVLRCWRLIRNESIAPDERRDGRVISMHQLKRVFNTCRIPGKDIDTLETHFCTRRQGNCPRHIIVSHRGRLFMMRAIDNEDRVLTPPELTAAFTEIMAYSDSRGSNSESMCPLTTLPRSDWATNRELLASLGDNVDVLRLISEAVTLVRLEEGVPASNTKRFWMGMGIKPSNVWADKSYSFLVFSDGTACTSCDHAAYDGTAVLTVGIFVEQVVYRIKGEWSLDKEWDREALASWPYPDCKGLALWEPIEFTSNAVLRSEVARGIQICETNCQNVDVMDYFYYGYGRPFLRTFKIHPDTVVQMALQLTFLRVHGEPGSTYQTASTRQFWHGRTETIRSCTEEVIAWARHVLDHGPTHSRSISLFKEAHRRHNDLRSRCEAGLGCDRHLLGLQMQSIETTGASPALFDDPLWRRTGGGGNFRLSTSFGGYYTMVGFMPPMCPDGYGVFYRIGIDRIQLIISAFNSHPDTSITKFTAALETSLDEIRSLLEKTGGMNSQKSLTANL